MSRLLKIAALSLATALVAAAAVKAATVTVTSVVTAGTALTVAAGTPPSFGVTLNGADQTVNYVLPMDVVDARGGTLGWNLTITSTTFTNGAGLGHSFAANASTITGVVATCGTGSTCLLPTNSVANTNLGLPGASGTPVKYLNAATSTGRGAMNVDATVAVVVPANVFAGSFTSTVTVAISSGP
jgi:hypothetical protein